MKNLRCALHALITLLLALGIVALGYQLWLQQQTLTNLLSKTHQLEEKLATPPPARIIETTPCTLARVLLIDWQLHAIAKEAVNEPGLAKTHLEGLLAWLAPEKERFQETYLALKTLNEAHPQTPWLKINQALDALIPMAVIVPTAKPQKPWYHWQHWITVQPRTMATPTAKLSALMEAKQAVEHRNLPHLQKVTTTLKTMSDQDTQLQAFLTKWQPYLQQPTWEIDSVLKTLITEN